MLALALVSILAAAPEKVPAGIQVQYLSSQVNADWTLTIKPNRDGSALARLERASLRGVVKKHKITASDLKKLWVDLEASDWWLLQGDGIEQMDGATITFALNDGRRSGKFDAHHVSGRYAELFHIVLTATHLPDPTKN